MKHVAENFDWGRSQNPIWPTRARPEAAELADTRPEGVPRATDLQAMQVTAEIIQRHIADRARRKDYFAADMFSDPAWDLLLRLYWAYLSQLRVSISSLTADSGITATTALRWIKKLHDGGCIIRTRDPTDDRRVFVGLSFKGLVALTEYFHSCGYATPRI